MNECWRVAENVTERFFPIDKHISCAAAHEEFHARTRYWVESFDVLDVVVRGTKIEAIIHVAAPFSKGIAFLQELERGSLGNDIRHVEHSRHATSGSSPRLALHRGLMRKTRVTHMDMLIDDARQQETVGTIDQLIAIMNGQLCFSGNLSDTTVLNEDRSPKALTFIDYSYVLYDDSAACHSFP